jgi:cob(I)alamin adenosyltransferase
LHVCRTVCRRAERSAWRAAEVFGTDTAGGISGLAITYLNRLSDLLFILSRAANRRDGDVLWVPGADRLPSAPSE